MKKASQLLFVLLMLFNTWTSPALMQPRTPEVLILHSYHYEFSWTRSIQAGIERALAESGMKVNMQTEFMDARRIEAKEYSEILADLYAEKFKNRHFAAIVVSDNNALDFVVKYRERLFSGVPVVFCGINDYHDSMLKGASGFTGIAETVDFNGTLTAALSLHQHVKNIYIFGDNSVSYYAIRRELMEIAPRFSNQVAFFFYEGEPIEDVVVKVKEMGPEDLLFFISSLRNRQGEHISFEEMMEIVSNASPAPVYSLWDFFLGHGMVGGKLVSGVTQGEAAGKIAQRILAGEDPKTIPVLRNNPAEYMFDYNQLQRFKISPDSLPANSILINKPQSVYTFEKPVVMIAAITLAIAAVVVSFLLFMVKRWRRLNRKLYDENEYLESLHEVACGLMNRLELNSLLESIVQRAAEMVNTKHGFIYLVNEETDLMEVRVGLGLHSNTMGFTLRRGESMSGQVWTDGQALCENNYQSSCLKTTNPLFSSVQAALTVPLKTEEKVIGVIGLTFIEPGLAFSVRDMEVVARFAELAAIAIDNAKLYEQIKIELHERSKYEEKLHFLSFHDSMTGLFNRRYLDEELRRQDQRQSGSVGIMICDVDGLKFMNDTFGHEQGDKLLITVANILRESVQSSGTITRVGGDEFVAVLPSAGRDELEAAYRSVQKRMMQCNEHEPAFYISLSIGYAVSENPGIPMLETYKQADNNMYREKLHRSQSARNAMIQMVMQLLSVRDCITEEHSGRMQNWVVELAKHFGITEEKYADMRLFAQFHDIGKVGISDEILKKKESLTSAEMEIMKRHCEIGHRIVQSSPELAPIADWVLKHQERWDGKGYPLGLSGADIPLECRILAVVDAYDAMTSNRPYRQAMSHELAIKELEYGAGAQFDPEVVSKFLQLLDERLQG